MESLEPVTPHIPLTEATFLILLSLLPGPNHGYAIAREVRSLSGDRLRLGASTLYTSLKRLLEAGWIERAGENPSMPNSVRPRKTYQLTGLGRQVLQTEIQRLQTLVQAAQRISAGGEK